MAEAIMQKSQTDDEKPLKKAPPNQEVQGVKGWFLGKLQRVLSSQWLVDDWWSKQEAGNNRWWD